MSLHAELKIGTTCVGWIEILRVTNTGRGYLADDEVSEYEVYHQVTRKDTGNTRKLVGKVSHVYGAGAYVLMSKACALLGAEGY